MSATFNFFLYGPLPTTDTAERIFAQCTKRSRASVRGTLYDIDDQFPVVMLYGDTTINGDIVECAVTTMNDIDQMQCIHNGTLRRIATNVVLDDASHVPCWILVAGPAIAHQLTPDARIADGVWTRTS